MKSDRFLFGSHLKFFTTMCEYNKIQILPGYTHFSVNLFRIFQENKPQPVARAILLIPRK